MINGKQFRRLTVCSVLVLFFSMFVCGPIFAAETGTDKLGQNTGKKVDDGISGGTIALGAVAAAVAAGIIASGGGGGGGGAVGGGSKTVEQNVEALVNANPEAAAALNEFVQMAGAGADVPLDQNVLTNFAGAMSGLNSSGLLDEFQTQMAATTLSDWQAAFNAGGPSSSTRTFVTNLQTRNPEAYAALQNVMSFITPDQFASLQRLLDTLNLNNTAEMRAFLAMLTAITHDYTSARHTILTTLHPGYTFTFTTVHHGGGVWTTTTHATRTP